MEFESVEKMKEQVKCFTCSKALITKGVYGYSAVCNAAKNGIPFYVPIASVNVGTGEIKSLTSFPDVLECNKYEKTI